MRCDGFCAKAKLQFEQSDSAVRPVNHRLMRWMRRFEGRATHSGGQRRGNALCIGKVISAAFRRRFQNNSTDKSVHPSRDGEPFASGKSLIAAG